MADNGKPKANFYKDLVRGKNAEEKFLKQYGQYLTPTNGREGDFLITDTKIKVEQKSDFYSHEAYHNFIAEIYRSGKKPGGAQQALEHGCEYYAYWFVNDDKLYLFKTVQFIARVKKVAKKLKLELCTISNGSYDTSFYKVPRKEFEDIMLQWHSTIERRYNVAAKRKAKSENKKV